jgi:nicotinate-nucleotide adenylyltransferase
MKRIGILGGTFDPPHLGHLLIAEEVRIGLELDEIWFIPNQVPPHKQEAATNAEARIDMVKRAIRNNPSFRINSMEVERSGKSYTADTVRILKEEHPDTAFYFIIGADMVEYLPHWHKIDQLIELITFVGVKRPGYQLKTEYPITEVEIPLIDISSTLVRKRLAENRTVNYLIPETVYAYIKEKRLYEKR